MIRVPQKPSVHKRTPTWQTADLLHLDIAGNIANAIESCNYPHRHSFMECAGPGQAPRIEVNWIRLVIARVKDYQLASVQIQQRKVTVKYERRSRDGKYVDARGDSLANGTRLQSQILEQNSVDPFASWTFDPAR
jgi:hypothetical protein